MVTLSNCGTSFFAGFVIFAIIGFMAEQLNIDIEKAAVGGELYDIMRTLATAGMYYNVMIQ